jgi:hypothetical protein
LILKTSRERCLGAGIDEYITTLVEGKGAEGYLKAVSIITRFLVI